MKLIELKVLAPKTAEDGMQKFADNFSLGSVKEALRASKTTKFDPKLVKALGFASSLRKSNDKVSADTMSCTIELPMGLIMDITLELKNDVMLVTSLTQVLPKDEK
jgi:hypothetical protein